MQKKNLKHWWSLTRSVSSWDVTQEEKYYVSKKKLHQV